ncbi:FecR family protein [Niastella sp. OAS944]|uniref:FecR family protein n=1 Tax=Niastella sp. OAS944 TaxID=2664089 RepID=UPI003485DA68|nr:ferric-dicitrate binding protein FerR (iron transport regulator) [Chitinophagaceae bacterium OAS944]
MNEYTEINNLILRHLKQEITPEETATLNAWVEESEQNRQFFNRINNTPALMAEVKALSEGKKIDLDAAWARVKAVGWGQPISDGPAKVITIKWWQYAVAMAVLLMATTVTYVLQQANKTTPKPAVVQTTPHDAVPKTNKAYLTLENGKTIVLDSLQSGLLATQGTTKVMREQDGVISYSSSKAAEQKLIYNTITVPRGSDVVYLQLSDGSKVWLNAASSIRYPVAFSEEERKVEVTGEAYFEVTPSNSPKGGGLKQRFIVSKGNMNVTVLGTRFNVNSYENEENIKVTLLEGSVKVQHERVERIIKPGEQAVVDGAKINVVSDVDLEQVMAWKDGKFLFDNTDLAAIMRQIERWYNVEVNYQGDVLKQGITLTGEISRYNNASQVLELLEATRLLDFTIDSKGITVKSTDVQQ